MTPFYITKCKHILQHPSGHDEYDRKEAWFNLAKYYLKQKHDIEQISNAFGTESIKDKIDENKEIGELLDKRQLKLWT